MTYIALEDLDFMWDHADVETVKRMWNKGISLDSIAETTKRERDEVAVLIMDLARKEEIVLRTSGFKGTHTVTAKRNERRKNYEYTHADIALAKQNGISYGTFLVRIKRGWSVEDATTIKSNRKAATSACT